MNQVTIFRTGNPATNADPATFTYELLDTSLNPLTNSGSGSPGSPFVNLASGDYFVRAIQGNGCTSGLLFFSIEDRSAVPIVSIQKDSDQFSNNSDPASWTGALSAQVSESADNPAPGAPFVYTYAWYTEAEYPSGISFSDQPVVSGLDAGRYFVVVNNTSTGCSSVASASIPRVIIPPVAQFAVNTPATCLDDASITLVQLEQNGLITDFSDYEFSIYREEYPGNLLTTVSSPASDLLLENLTEGTYYVQVYNANLNIVGDVSQLDIVKNTFGPVVNLDYSRYKPQQSCNPDVPNGIMAVEAYETDYSIGDYAYQWYEGRAVESVALIDGATESILENLGLGYYTVEVTNQLTACTTVATFYVEEDSGIPVISASSSANNVCDPANYNGSVSAQVVFANGRTLSGNSSAGFRFDWYAGRVISDSPIANGERLENLGPGYYTVQAIDLRNDGCVSAPVTVQVNDATQLDELQISVDNPQENCDPAMANGRLSASINGNTSGYTFRWYNANNNAISTSSSVQGLRAGNYRLEATNQITGCVLEGQASIAEEFKTVTPPSITINSHQNRCDEPNGTVTAMIPSLISDYEFFWYDANGNRLPVEEPATQLSGLTAGIYQLQLLELRSGCRTELVEFEILDQTFKPAFQVYTEPAVCNTKSGLVRIIPEDVNSIERVEWYSSYGKDVVGLGMEISEMFAGEYRYEVYATNGCSMSGRVVVEGNINVYNGLSPNQDGENDYFHIDCIEKFPENFVKIFNRAGALVYEASYYDNSSTFFEGLGNRGLYIGGKELPDGTYFYVIDKNDGSKPKTGYLELSR